MQLANALNVCRSIAKSETEFHVDASVSEEKGDEANPKTVLATACSSMQRSLRERVQLCTVPSVDLAKKTMGAATNKKPKSKKLFAGQVEINFNPPLPYVSDKYQFIQGVSMGALRMARHKESKQKRAILTLPRKNIPPGTTDDLGAEIKKHLETLLKVDHVNVLALHEACEDHNNIYLAYDWPEGGLMLDYLTHYHEDVSEAHIASIIREAIAALGAAARFNIHHLDWSLLCFFLGYKNRFSPLKLFGLGLAGFLVPLVTTRKVSRSNKHFYASPELIMENYRLMPHAKLSACDIWSVGCLLYMLFSGRPPFFGQQADVETKIKKAQWGFGYEFEGISREAKNAIELMLKKKWEARPVPAELLKLPFFQMQIGARRTEGVLCQDALAKLDQFARETHCKQTLARLLADLGLQEQQYSHLEEEFKKLDLDGNGVVEVAELYEIASEIPDLDASTVSSIIAACDRNGNSTVDISEFVAAVVLELEQKDERLVSKAFEKMDMNRDARITKGEIFRVLRQYSGNLNPTDIASFVKDVDKDKDQKIDFNEFKNLFPHVKERDEEVKSQMRALADDVINKKKQLSQLQGDTEKLFKAMKTVAGQLSYEGHKMQKSFYNEHVVRDKLQAFIDVVEEFAKRGMASGAEKAMEIDKSSEQTNLVGLAVMHKYNKKPEKPVLLRAKSHSSSGSSGDESPVARTASRYTVVESAKEGQSLGSQQQQQPAQTPGAAKAGVPGAGDAGSAAPESRANAALAAAGLVENRSVAEVYTARDSDTKHMSVQQLRREAQRRRKYFWMGMGDGIGAMHSWIRDGCPPQHAKGVGKQVVGIMDDMDTAPLSDFGSESLSRRQSSRRSTRKSTATSSMIVEEQDQNEEGFVPWASAKKMRYVKEAMVAASGPVMDRIGTRSAEEVKEPLAQLGKRLLHDYGLNQDLDEKLGDLAKLTRYKCARTWLPRLKLWQEELTAAMDESKVHVVERRSLYVECTKSVAQQCERIMFSLAELVMAQEEVFTAMCKTEEMAPLAPATKRFLPVRQGEVDENARTPRDEYDAVNLAPAELEITATNAEVQGSVLDIADQMNVNATGRSSVNPETSSVLNSELQAQARQSTRASVSFSQAEVAGGLGAKSLTRSSVRAKVK